MRWTWCVLVAVLMGFAMSQPAVAQPAAGADADGPSYSERRRAATAKITEVIERLVEEAEQIKNLDRPDPQPLFRRPHPMVSRITADDVPFLLPRMNQRLTGNEYEDVYVLWHLLLPVTEAMEQHALQSIANEELGDLSETSGQLIKLFEKLPGMLSASTVPQVTHEPKDIYRQYVRLGNEARRLTTVTRGYPPFQTVISGRAAFPHISDGDKRKAEQIWEQMEKLRPLFKAIHNPGAIAYNNRVRAMNNIIRYYRGDLTYTVILTGDPKILKMVLNKAGEFAENRDSRSFDVIQHIYKAAFMGYLPIYQLADEKLLIEAAASLRKSARRAPGFSSYGNEYRSFEDYVFHLTFMLEDLDNVPRPRTVERPPAPPANAGQMFTAGNLTLEQIDKARRRAIEALYEQEPRVDFMDLDQQTRLGRRNQNYHQYVHDMGHQAAALWALVAAKESYQNPDLLRRLHWVLGRDASHTYDRSMRTILLSNLPARRWRDHLRRDAVWLADALTNQGAFPYQNTGNDFDRRVDMANSQYGVLGLWALEQSDMKIKQEGWERVDKFWRSAYRDSGSGAGGWSILPPSRDGGRNADERAEGVNGPMTAGGVSTLMLTDRYIRGPRMVDVGEDLRAPEMVKGLKWLDENFEVELTGTVDENDFYLYMWTMQRVGKASGFRTFNGKDWFRDVTAKVLNEQQPDGSWAGPKGRLLSTAFALLYLGNSYDPLAIGKIRVPEGAWNNRPHDLWNFSEWVSDEYEVSTGWQIFELEAREGNRRVPQNTFQLIEAPMQYFTTSDYVTFNDNQIKALRSYIEAGGLLVTSTDGRNADSARTIRELGEKLFPGQELQDVPNDHPFYGVHREVGLGLPLEMISNHIRPLWVHSPRDLSRPLQAMDVGRSDAFSLLSNIYLYTIGMNPRRTRLDSDHLVKNPVINPVSSFSIARVRHDGRYDPEPAALRQLGAFMHNEHRVDVSISEATPDKLGTAGMAFLSMTEGDTLSESQTTALRSYVEGGGTLWIDAAGGSNQASTAAFEVMKNIMPDAVPTRLLADSPVISGQHDGQRIGHDMGRVQFRPYALRVMGPVNTPRLQAVEIDGRPAIIFSAEDVTCALAGLKHWGIFGYLPESARNLVANSIVHKMKLGPTNVAVNN